MSTAATPQAVKSIWNIDPAHSVAEFKIKHMMITNVKGQFTGLKGVLTLDESDLLNSHVEVSIDAASINTREADRARILKAPTFSTWTSSQIYRSSPPALAAAKMEN
jgi:polyisoprenoid-binding protein YceI